MAWDKNPRKLQLAKQNVLFNNLPASINPTYLLQGLAFHCPISFVANNSERHSSRHKNRATNLREQFRISTCLSASQCCQQFPLRALLLLAIFDPVVAIFMIFGPFVSQQSPRIAIKPAQSFRKAISMNTWFSGGHYFSHIVFCIFRSLSVSRKNYNSGLKHPVKTYCRAKVHVCLPVTLFVLLIVLFMNCECYCLQV